MSVSELSEAKRPKVVKHERSELLAKQVTHAVCVSVSELSEAKRPKVVRVKVVQ